MTPGRYIELRREAAGLSLEDLALRIETDVPVSARSRAELLGLMESDTAVISADVVTALRDLRAMGAFDFDPYILWQLVAIHAGAEINPPEVCATCGCSWMDPCLTEHGRACCWANHQADLCSACANGPLLNRSAGGVDADQGAAGDRRSLRAAPEADRLAAVRHPDLVAHDVATAVSA